MKRDCNLQLQFPMSPDLPTTRSDKQTLSFLLRRFQQAGIEPRTDLGQNFLIDMNLQRCCWKRRRSGRTT